MCPCFRMPTGVAMKRGTRLLIATLFVVSACVDAQSERVSELTGQSADTRASLLKPGGNWPQYLFDATHSSHNSRAVAITRDNVDSLNEEWRWKADPPNESGQPPAQLLASPTVFRGRVYIGARTGDLYALNAENGNTVWRRSLGYLKTQMCGARGITSTAALSGAGTDGGPVVYVGGGDGRLYALDGDDGGVIWRSVVVRQRPPASNGGYIWSSPTLIGQHLYIGVSSQCGSPLIRGGVKVFDRSSGDLLGKYWTVSKEGVGGSVWTSVAGPPSGKALFVSTGNSDPERKIPPGDSYSVVRLKNSTLEKKDAWTVPGLMGTDQDFPSSPVLFSARAHGSKTQMIGACNKNGTFYALDASALWRGPMWTAKLSAQWPEGHCLPAGVWDENNRRLFLAAAQTKIDGQAFRGSIRLVGARTGKAKWILGLPGVVWGTPSLNGSGILAVPSFDVDGGAERGVFLVDANQGKLLARLDVDDSPVFSQPVFAGSYLFVATFNQGLIAFTPRD
jgi:outer membrane protein assembly factor BamB